MTQQDQQSISANNYFARLLQKCTTMVPNGIYDGSHVITVSEDLYLFVNIQDEKVANFWIDHYVPNDGDSYPDHSYFSSITDLLEVAKNQEEVLNKLSKSFLANTVHNDEIVNLFDSLL